jgi:glycosyltransferase involved in cell wall biosynthesis
VHILHVLPSYLPAVRFGGPVKTVHALCRSLVARGHTVEVVTTNLDVVGTTSAPLDRQVELDGVGVRYFSAPLFRRLYWSPGLGRDVRRRIGKFDIVHTHSVFLWPTWAAARSALAAGVPYVVTPRGMLVPDLIRHKSRWAKSLWIAAIERRNVVKAAAVHVTSEREASDLRSFGWPVRRIEIIPNAVDDPLADEGSSISADIQAAIGQGNFVLALTRINWKKGLDRLIAAMPSVGEMRLIIVGDDIEGHAAPLAEVGKRAGVSNRVTILPRHVEGADKEALFTAASIFAMPSLSENFGMAAVEAMRRGVPVLTTPEVGMASIVRECGGGLVVEGNAVAIADGLNRLVGNPSLACAMGEAGRAHVAAHYGWPSIAERMERLYQSILAGRPGPGQA